MSKIKAFSMVSGNSSATYSSPHSGSKRRAEQQAYEERLEAANKR